MGLLSSNGMDVGSGEKSGNLLEAHVDNPCSWPWTIQHETKREHAAITLKGMLIFTQIFPTSNMEGPELPF